MTYKIHKELPTGVKTTFEEKGKALIDVKFEIEEVFNSPIRNVELNEVTQN